MTAHLLTLTDISTFIGDYHILQGVNLNVEAGGVSALLGRNGAGKTTTLRSIMGLCKPLGDIIFDGKNISGLSTAAISRLGIGYVPESMGLFAGLTVAENLRLAARTKAADKSRLEQIHALFPALVKLADRSAGLLSGGQKQMLSIAKAMIEPKRLILIDEPTKGLAPSVVADLVEAFRQLTAQGTSILLVEQNFHFAASLAKEATVIESGRTSWQGQMGEIVENAALKKELLGVALG
ncbi:MAG: ABC transporter ATP-binding protein [Pelagibacterium sp. SCN 64-44]|nr:MAG: ABC transporter ATP-binding protein [Pelagibacterium sp. SCN 64-44]